MIPQLRVVADPVRVLVVDDTPDLRELLALAMESGGYHVVADAGNGLEGIAAAREYRPDLILLDLAMPVMDGLEALPELRMICPNAIIVVLSGFGATVMARQAIEQGANGYLQKGTPLAGILRYVGDLLHQPYASPRPVSVVAAPRERAATSGPSAEAMAIAPFGFMEVTDNPDLACLHLNTEALRMIGVPAQPGDSLTQLAPRFAQAISDHRLSDGGTFDAILGLPRVPVSVMIRRSVGSLFIYLRRHSPDDEVAFLRRAFATTAHEIRNPLAVLVGVAETIELHRELSDEQRNRLLASVARQARLLDNITADLLIAAQAQKGNLQVDAVVVDPQDLLAGLVADGYDARVEITLPCLLLADPYRLQQMISNLLSNAHKYAQPPFVVAVRPVQDRVLIEVHDSGPGVPEEFVPLLFQEFARASGTAARGTGLGLFVVRSLAEAHGGTVAYARRAQGGSTFTLTFPAATS